MPSPSATQEMIETFVPLTTAYPAVSRNTTNTTAIVNSPSPARRTRVTVPSGVTLIASGDNAAKAGGVAILSFPAGKIIPLGAIIVSGSIVGDQTDANNTAGEIGLGTVVGSGSNATLGAVGATSEDFMEGATIGNMTAGAAVSVANLNDGPRDPIGNASAAWSLYLNLATTFGNYGTAQNITTSGAMVIDLVYIPLK